MKKQSGNALWLILLGIFLLGGLTVLLSRTGSNTEETGSTEKIRLSLSKHMQNLQAIQTAIQSMTMNGVSENEISFENTVFTRYDNAPIQGPGSNPNCTSEACKVFGSATGLKPQYANENILSTASYVPTNWKFGVTALEQFKKHDIGTAEPDLFLVTMKLSKEACMAFNNMVGVVNTASAPPSLTPSPTAGGIFNGTYNTNAPAIDNSFTALNGKKNFCVNYIPDGAEAYHIFYLVLAR